MKFDKKILIDSLIGLVLGGGLVLIAYYGLNKPLMLKFFPKENLLSKIIFFSSLVIAPFLAIVVHELGHLLAGIFQGFRVELFVVYFFGLRRANGKLELFFNTNVQYFGGVAATSPKTLQNDYDLIRKYATILICGPIASLLLAIISFIIIYYYDFQLNPFFGLLTVTSFGIFIATTLPEKSGIFFTDRKRFQRLLDKGDIGKIELAFLQIVNQSLLENTYKNLSIEKVNMLKQDSDKIIRFWGYYFEFQFYKDNALAEDMQLMRASLDEYKKVIPKALWKSLEID